MPDKEEREKLLEMISENIDHYKNNPSALKDLEESLEEVEAFLKGEIKLKTGRQLLEELREEDESERKSKINKAYEKAVELNGEALKRLSQD